MEVTRARLEMACALLEVAPVRMEVLGARASGSWAPRIDAVGSRTGAARPEQTDGGVRHRGGPAPLLGGRDE